MTLIDVILFTYFNIITINSIPSDSKNRTRFSFSFNNEHMELNKFSTISDSSSDPASLFLYAYIYHKFISDWEAVTVPILLTERALNKTSTPSNSPTFKRISAFVVLDHPIRICAGYQ